MGQDLMNITIQNYGKIHLEIDAVYVNDQVTSTYISGTETTVTLGNLISVKFISPVPLSHDETYEIIVVTERGTKDAASWTA